MPRFSVFGVIIIALMVGYALTGCGHPNGYDNVPQTEKSVSTAKVAEKPPVVDKPTVVQALEAISRSHPHSIQVCYDSVNDGFFIEYSVLPDGTSADGFFHGWQFLKFDKFYKASNDTWFTQERLDTDYIHVFPDPTGLPCKKT